MKSPNKAHTTSTPWPIIEEFVHDDPVYHWGNLDGSSGSEHKSSMEGPCLSCAPDRKIADAWQEIALLGGLPLWTITIKGGFRLLAMHGAAKLKSVKAAVVKAGLVEPVTVFRVTWYDSEMDGNVHSEFATVEQAQAEMGEGRRLTKRKGFVATPALNAYWGSRHGKQDIGPLSALDAAIVAFADMNCPHLHGVSWADHFDVAALSAPRIGLFQRTIPLLSKTVSEVDDD